MFPKLGRSQTLCDHILSLFYTLTLGTWQELSLSQCLSGVGTLCAFINVLSSYSTNSLRTCDITGTAPDVSDTEVKENKSLASTSFYSIEKGRE